MPTCISLYVALILTVIANAQKLSCLSDLNCPKESVCLTPSTSSSTAYVNSGLCKSGELCLEINSFCVNKMKSGLSDGFCTTDADCPSDNPHCIAQYSVCGKLPNGFSCLNNNDCLTLCCYFSTKYSPQKLNANRAPPIYGSVHLVSSCGCPQSLVPGNITNYMKALNNATGSTFSKNNLDYCPAEVHKQSSFFQNMCGVLDNGFPCQLNEDCRSGYCDGASGFAFTVYENAFQLLSNYVAVPFPTMCSDMPAGSSSLPIDANEGAKSQIWGFLKCSPDINMFICPNNESCNLYSNLCGKSAISEGCFVNSDCQSGYCQNPNHLNYFFASDIPSFVNSLPATVFTWATSNNYYEIIYPIIFGKCGAPPSALVPPTPSTLFGDCLLGPLTKDYDFSNILLSSTFSYNNLNASCAGLSNNNNCNFYFGMCGQTGNGFPCIKNSDCVSTSFCSNSTCASIPIGQSIPQNTNFSDCRSFDDNVNSCGNQVCNQYSGLCGYSQLNEICSSNSDCATGLCLGSMYQLIYPFPSVYRIFFQYGNAYGVCSTVPKGLITFPAGSSSYNSYCTGYINVLSINYGHGYVDCYGYDCFLMGPNSCNWATGLSGVVDVPDFPCLASSDCGVGLFCYGRSSRFNSLAYYNGSIQSFQSQEIETVGHCALISLYGSFPLGATLANYNSQCIFNDTTSCPNNDCNMFTRLCGKGSLNDRCLVNSDCISPLFCNGGDMMFSLAGVCSPIPIGQSFFPASPSSSSFPFYNGCYSYDGHNNKIQIPSSCPSSSMCNFYTGLCGKSADGLMCSSSSDCISGYCEHFDLTIGHFDDLTGNSVYLDYTFKYVNVGVCKSFPIGALLPPYKSQRMCSSSRECIDCNLITGLCGSSVKLNDSCSFNSDCLSAYCLNYICVPLPSYFVPPLPLPYSALGNCNTPLLNGEALNSNNIALLCPSGYYCDLLSGLCSNQYNSLTLNVIHNNGDVASNTSSKGLSIGAVVGIIVGIVILLVATAFYAFYSNKKTDITIKARRIKEGFVDGEEGFDKKEEVKPKASRSKDVLGTPHLRKVV